MDRVSNNDDFLYTRQIGSLIDTASNGEKLSLGRCNVGCVMNSFDDRSVMDMDVSNKHNNIVLDICIWNDESM